MEEVLIPFPINITLTNADTEYTQVLPKNCKSFTWQSRGGESFRYSFVTEKVATPTAPWMTVKEGAGLTSPGKFCLHPSYTTLYLASATAGTVIEILAYCTRVIDPYTGTQS